MSRCYNKCYVTLCNTPIKSTIMIRLRKDRTRLWAQHMGRICVAKVLHERHLFCDFSRFSFLSSFSLQINSTIMIRLKERSHSTMHEHMHTACVESLQLKFCMDKPFSVISHVFLYCPPWAEMIHHQQKGIAIFFTFNAYVSVKIWLVIFGSIFVILHTFVISCYSKKI